jgi:hypothetical protein
MKHAIIIGEHDILKFFLIEKGYIIHCKNPDSNFISILSEINSKNPSVIEIYNLTMSNYILDVISILNYNIKYISNNDFNLTFFREKYNIFVCNGVKINKFEKIMTDINNLIKKKQKTIKVKNLDKLYHWCSNKDYVKGLWLALQHDFPEDYIFSSNEKRSVREFIEKVCGIYGICIKWKGTGINEVGFDSKTNNILVRVNYPTANFELDWNHEMKFDKFVEEKFFDTLF